VVPQPSGAAALFGVIGGSGLAVLAAAMWLRWRRFGDIGAM
jgi:hypothetical protein